MKQYIQIILAAALTLGAFSCHKEEKKPEIKKEKPFRYDDLQNVHAPAAQKFGVTPFADRNVNFDSIPKLEKVEESDILHIEYLSHSVPYLTHNAKQLLNEIGQTFQDSLRARGVQVYRITATSLLRTEADVTRLTRVNSNASAKSAHCYGTTFDIAHNSFAPTDSKGNSLTYREMKLVLAHVLYRMRMQKKCWVLIEERQKCFHITCNS